MREGAPSAPILRMGVVGVGSLGFHHARILADLPGVTMAGVFDIRPERSQEVGRQLGVPCARYPRRAVGGGRRGGSGGSNGCPRGGSRGRPGARRRGARREADRAHARRRRSHPHTGSQERGGHPDRPRRALQPGGGRGRAVPGRAVVCGVAPPGSVFSAQHRRCGGTRPHDPRRRSGWEPSGHAGPGHRCGRRAGPHAQRRHR